MPLLLQVRHDQPLPVDRKHIRPAAVLKHKPAPGKTGLQKKMYFRVMAQRLKVSDAFHSSGDRLFINDRRVAKRYTKAESLADHPLQDLLLHLSHDLRGDLLLLLVIIKMQSRIFLFQGAQAPVGFEKVFSGRKDDCTAKDRLQQLLRAACLRADALPDSGPGEARHGTDFTCGSFLPGLKFIP